MDNHDKLSNSCVENPKLGHRYVKFLSNGLKASRSGFSSANTSSTQYSIVLDLKLSPICEKGYKRKAGFFYWRAWKIELLQFKINPLSGTVHLETCSADQSGEVQINPWYFSAVQSGEVKRSLRQSILVKCSAVQSSPLQCSSAQCGPVHCSAMQSIHQSPFPFSPDQSRPIKYNAVHFNSEQPGPLTANCSRVQSSQVQSGAIRNSTVQSRPFQNSQPLSRQANCITAQSSHVKRSAVWSRPVELSAIQKSPYSSSITSVVQSSLQS